MIPALVAALADRYRLERELGQGGMATVYLAHDLKHDRPVALKVLKPELAQSIGPERFQREIRLAARLQHPHILPVFDSGQTEGSLWYAMPYVDGETLRARFAHERQFAIDESLRIARSVAAALDYAHRQGVIHRDIKPENILLTRDGDVLVADFGIARVAGEGSERLTETGLAVGTPAYMSPEQASGDRQLDVRSDQYSLACVLYEMLAGEPPFTGPTAQAILSRRFSEVSRPLDAVRETVPTSVTRAVARALARVPADRFASVAEFAQALDSPMAPAAPTQLSIPVTDPRWTGRRVALLALGAFALGLGVLFAWRRPSRAAEADTPAAGPVRIAVLPFDNLGDSTDAYFADGITDAVRGKLAGLPRLEVTASTSSNQYRRTTKTPQQIGQELGVQYLLVGRIRYARQSGAASRVQVSPELIRTNTASTTWQQPFDASLTDVFQVQGDIASRVAGALGVALGASERTALSQRPTTDLAAYDAYLRGMQLLPEQDADAARRAIAAFKEAVARDSTFAAAWARLAEIANRGWQLGMGSGFDSLAREATGRATRLAPDRPDGYVAAALIAWQTSKNAPAALKLFRRALTLAPSDASVLANLGALEAELPQVDSALAHLHRARELDPQNTAIAGSLALANLYFKRFAEAEQEVERGLTIQPGSRTLLIYKAVIALGRGDLASARSVLRQLGSGNEAGAGLALCWDFPWALDSAQQETYLHLSAAPFGGNPVWQGNAFAVLFRVRGDSAAMRRHADSGLRSMEDWRHQSPKEPFMHAVRGMLLGMLGRRAEAHAEAQAAVRLITNGETANGRAYIAHLAAWTEVLAGQDEAAIALLSEVIRGPYKLTPGWLAIDPTFARLKGRPGFERLLRSGS